MLAAAAVALPSRRRRGRRTRRPRGGRRGERPRGLRRRRRGGLLCKAERTSGLCSGPAAVRARMHAFLLFVDLHARERFCGRCRGRLGGRRGGHSRGAVHALFLFTVPAAIRALGQNALKL